MIRIQFNDSASMINADFKLISNNIVQLTGADVKADTSGFKAYRLDGAFLGDYSDFTETINSTEGIQFERKDNV